MKRSCMILVAAALGLMPGGLLAAEGQSEAAAPIPSDEAYQPVFTDGTARPLYEPQFLGRGPSSGVSDPAVRLGWWGTYNTGNPTKTGEWEGLGASPFIDIDDLFSNGIRTGNFFITNYDNESTRGHLDYYGPSGFKANVDYERFIHRLDHDPLGNFDHPDSGVYIGQRTDLNAGQDYAIRVQKFDARFKGHITDNIKWRLNLWGMRKQGIRQASAFSHSCGERPEREALCHIGSQAQRIDWLTTEIEPVIETKLGPVTVEYSRTMRSFNASDQLVESGVFNADSPFGTFYKFPSLFLDAGTLPQSHPYAVVPDNYTQIDRLKFGVNITDDTDLYALLYYGDTENKDTAQHRTFHGWDVRVSNRSIDGVTVAGYAKQNTSRYEYPKTYPEADLFEPGEDNPANDTVHPIDREYTTAGVKLRWLLGQRRYSSSGWSLATGYEYSQIKRNFATYELEINDVPEPVVFVQPNTYSNTFFIGPEWRYSSALDTFVRYKVVSTKNPIYGVNPNQHNSLADALNTNQPGHVNGVEFGGTWMPADTFLLTATIGIERRSTNNFEAFFNENNYPAMISAWWAPTQRLNLNAGLGFFSNFISQDITIGNATHIFGDGTEPVSTTRWGYNGTANLVSLGANYAWTDRVSLVGGLEYVRGNDFFNDPSTPELSVHELPGASNVLVETWRCTAGVDYLLSDRTSLYFRYVYYDYEDKSFADTFHDPDPNSGTSNFFLGGFTAVF